MKKNIDLQKIKGILHFWFEGKDLKSQLPPQSLTAKWWGGGQVDKIIIQRFAADTDRLYNGELEDWKEDQDGALAYIIVADQFSRNAFRSTAKSIRCDPFARKAADEILKNQERYKQYPYGYRYFIILPFVHSQSMEDQIKFRNLYDQMIQDAAKEKNPYSGWYQSLKVFQKDHFEIISKFGRYPYRNEALGRQSTPEQLQWLKTGKTFGW